MMVVPINSLALEGDVEDSNIESSSVAASYDEALISIREVQSLGVGGYFVRAISHPFISEKGDGMLVIECSSEDDNVSRVIRKMSQYPLKYMVTRRTTNRDTPWIYLVGYGGGLVGGDRSRQRWEVRKYSTCVVTTQSATKVFRPKEHNVLDTVQVYEVSIAKGALLCMVPEPTLCFSKARLHQQQTYWISDCGSLVAVDWYMCGRVARGENWAFEKLISQTTVVINGVLDVVDGLSLEAPSIGSHLPSISERMYGVECICSCILVGPRTLTTVNSALSIINDIASSTNAGQLRPVMISASPLHRDGGGNGELIGAILRIAGSDMQATKKQLSSLLSNLKEELGDNIWA